MEPTTFKQTVVHPKWQADMKEELNALKYNNTWSLVSLPVGNVPSVANGYTRSSIVLMEVWNVTRLI